MKIILILFLLFFSITSFAVTPEQNYMNREPQRREYAQNMQRTHDMLNRSIAAAGDGKNVTQTGSASSTASDGSRITGGGSVSKPVNPSGVGKAIVERLGKAKSLAKASLPSFLGSAALTALINGIGWVMDEGGKVSKKSDEASPSDPSNQYIYQTSGHNDTYASTPEYSCSLEAKNKNASSVQFNWGVTYFNSRILNGNGTDTLFFYCLLDQKNNSTGVVTSQSIKAQGSRTLNPNYSPTATPILVPVSNTELADKIAEQVTNNITNNTTNNNITNIVNNAYSYDSSNGADSSDPSNALAVDGANDIRSAVNNASTASTPTPTGSQRGYYKITDGTKTVEGYVDSGSTTGTSTTDNTTTTTNPDGSTTTTTGTGSSNFQLPAFCDWASIVCDWYKDWKDSDQLYKDHVTKTEEHQTQEKSFWDKVTAWFDWTKESPEDKEEPEQQEPDTQGIFSKKFDAVFSLSKECPSDLKFNLETKYLSGTWDFSLNWLCIFFTFIAYPLQLLSHMIGIWILYEACIRKEIKW